MAEIKDYTKKAVTTVKRKVEIKRRDSSTGQYETSWQDVTSYVKKYGSVDWGIDSVRLNKFQMSGMNIIFTNDEGHFNSENSENSLWYGYMTRARTLVKVSAYFLDGTDEIPTTSTLFVGIIDGNIYSSYKNEITLPIKNSLSVLKDYPAENLTGWNSSSTASDIFALVRDQQDSSGSYIFRPFFDDTTSNWVISTTTTLYPNLNTSTSDLIKGLSVFDVLEKLGESENKSVYTDRGVIYFSDRDYLTTTTDFVFCGTGADSSYLSEYGKTIRKINKSFEDINNYYNRVQLKFIDSDTNTSYYTKQNYLSVSPTNPEWKYGQRTLKFENYWLSGTASAQAIGDAIYNDVSVLRDIVEFETSFVPGISLLKKVQLSHVSSAIASARYDVDNWDECYYDVEGGEAFDFTDTDFMIINCSYDLDALKCTFKVKNK